MQTVHKLLRFFTACSALLLAACSGDPTYDCGNVTVGTVAGSGVASYADGVATLASFNVPGGLATDGTNLYVADSSNHRVRRIVIATGQVSTLAGSGVAGYADGVGTLASFNGPSGLATDGTNLYVADSDNYRVRRIVLATGEVSTLAGSGVSGYADGVGAAASFGYLKGLATDGTNLYVADTTNSRVRRIVLATGEVSTLAGSGVMGYLDGPGTTAEFWGLWGLATDGTDLYVSEAINLRVRRIVLATGEVSTLAGSGSAEAESIDGTGTAATFNLPYGLATDGTNVYVTEFNGHRVRKIEIASAVVTTLAGSDAGYGDGPGKEARLNSPDGIVVHGTSQDGTNMYVADSSNHRIRKLNYLPAACPAPQTYAVGGAVTGLAAGATLVLRNNGGDDKTVSGNGVFAFSAAVGSGKVYSVSVLTQPAGQTCTVSNGSGTATANVDTVQVQCVSNSHTIGGTVSGLSGTVVLQNNGGDDRSVSADGSFEFAAPVASGSTYAVTVLTQPAGQTCTVSSGSGTANADVANVSVNCASSTSDYEIGGIVNGLNAVGLELENNGGDAIQVFPDVFSMSMPFTFPTRIPQDGTYSVTVRAQPFGQTCTVTAGGSGVATANVSDVTVDCLVTEPL